MAPHLQLPWFTAKKKFAKSDLVTWVPRLTTVMTYKWKSIPNFTSTSRTTCISCECPASPWGCPWSTLRNYYWSRMQLFQQLGAFERFSGYQLAPGSNSKWWLPLLKSFMSQDMRVCWTACSQWFLSPQCDGENKASFESSFIRNEFYRILGGVCVCHVVLLPFFSGVEVPSPLVKIQLGPTWLRFKKSN